MSMYLVTLLKDEKEIVTKAIVDKNEIEGVGKVPYLESVKKLLQTKGIIRNGRLRQGEYVLKPYFFFEGSQPMLTLKEMLDLLSECSAGIFFVVGNGGKNKEESDFFSAAGFEVHSIMYTDKEYFWNVFRNLLKYFGMQIKKEVFVEVFRQMMQKVGAFVCEEVFFSLVSKAKEREKNDGRGLW